MINLIKADLYRVFRCPAIYIALLLSLAINTLCLMESHVEELVPGSSAIYYNSRGSGGYEQELTGKDPGEVSVSDLEMFMLSLSEEEGSLPREIAAGNINIYSIILIVFAFLGSDISNKTVKNTLSTAISRRKYFISKLAAIEISSMILIAIANMYAYFMNRVLHPYFYTEPIGNIFKAMLYQLPLLMGEAAMLVLLALLVKRSSVFFVSAMAVIFILPQLVYQTFYIYEWEFLRIYIWKYQQSIALIWLANFPPMDYVITCAVIGVCEITVSSVLGYKIFNKTDL